MNVLSRLRERKGPIAERDGEVRGRLRMREGEKATEARQLRRNETLAEKRLWQQLRNRQVEGFKFVRQAPVGPYIADFLCRELRLIVEVDGATHSPDFEITRDAARSSQLEKLGCRVIRFHNDEVMNGMEEVLTLIRDALHSPSPSPLRRNGAPFSPARGRGQRGTA